ncbi:putative periplasmic lipoprotein [Ferruginibacter sp.]
MKRILFPLAAILFLSACNNNPDKKNTEAVTPAAPAVDKPATSSAGSSIKVTLTGGANAGSYTASSETATCSMGATGPKSFGNQYSVSGKAANEFSSLQLIVDDYEAAKSGTDKFYIKVAFGKVLVGNKYEINGSDNSLAGKKQGSGKLTIHESGSTKTATIQGKTADGVALDATLICSEVIAMPGN